MKKYLTEEFYQCPFCNTFLHEYFRRNYFLFAEIYKRCPKCRKVYQFKIKNKRGGNIC